MKEFDAYGKLKKNVEKLVDNDTQADVFFNNLNNHTSDIKVDYIDEIQDVLADYDNWSNEKFVIFPTTIQIYDGETNDRSTHSILLIWTNAKLYLYDPNGAYNTKIKVTYKSSVTKLKQSYGYMLNNTYFHSTVIFKKYIKDRYKITLNIPTDLGAQYLLPIEETNTIYIREGGYCMFFNYMVIEYILNNFEQPFESIYDTITKSPFDGVFPTPATDDDAIKGTAPENTFEGKTIQIVEQVFSKKGGNRKTKSKRKKNKTVKK